jgi:hypothetical protein
VKITSLIVAWFISNIGMFYRLAERYDMSMEVFLGELNIATEKIAGGWQMPDCMPQRQRGHLQEVPQESIDEC